jgi:hypothetical protein
MVRHADGRRLKAENAKCNSDGPACAIGGKKRKKHRRVESRLSRLDSTSMPTDRRSKRRYVRLKRTNLRVIGLSLNRSQKRSALLSTTPRLRTRSSTNDLAPLRRMWLLSLRHAPAFVGRRQEPSCCGLATAGAEIGRPAYIVASRRERR